MNTHKIQLNDAQVALLRDGLAALQRAYQERGDCLSPDTIDFLRQDHTYAPGEQGQDIQTVFEEQRRYMWRALGEMAKGEYGSGMVIPFCL